MKINTKLRYGLRTMIEIANCSSPDGILQKDIAINQQISVKYLDGIIASLKLKGLVINVKGKGSGYKITRPTYEINMLDIYTAFEPIIVVECTINSDFCKRSSDCISRKYWCELKKEFSAILEKKKLSQIISDTNNI